MKRLLLALIYAFCLTGCGQTYIHDRGPLETARLFWVVFMHDIGQRIIFEVLK